MIMEQQRYRAHPELIGNSTSIILHGTTRADLRSRRQRAAGRLARKIERESGLKGRGGSSPRNWREKCGVNYSQRRNHSRTGESSAVSLGAAAALCGVRGARREARTTTLHHVCP